MHVAFCLVDFQECERTTKGRKKNSSGATGSDNGKLDRGVSGSDNGKPDRRRDRFRRWKAGSRSIRFGQWKAGSQEWQVQTMESWIEEYQIRTMENQNLHKAQKALSTQSSNLEVSIPIFASVVTLM